MVKHIIRLQEIRHIKKGNISQVITEGWRRYVTTDTFYLKIGLRFTNERFRLEWNAGMV